MTLDQIISGAQKNDITAQSHLYQLFSAKLYGVCLKYSRNRQEAQDNLQNCATLIGN
ncbi:MAG: hypothetical protein H7174_10620 [Flavobacterium sp.]|nr:hypothetical protein [Flavobacterium sp.]